MGVGAGSGFVQEEKPSRLRSPVANIHLRLSFFISNLIN